MRLVVTRPAAEAAGWVHMLERRGIDAVALPLIEIRPSPDPRALADAWSSLATLHAVMFVSGNAVRAFFTARGAHAGWPPGVRAWCTGPGTRQALLDDGVPPGCIDSPAEDVEQFDSESLWARVGGGVDAGDAVLIVRGGDAAGQPAGRGWLAERLQERGAKVTELVAYVRACPAWDERTRSAALRELQSATWLLSSSEAVQNLRELVPGANLATARAIATHKRIARAARRAGFGVVRESRPAMEDVIATLESAG